VKELLAKVPKRLLAGLIGATAVGLLAWLADIDVLIGAVLYLVGALTKSKGIVALVKDALGYSSTEGADAQEGDDVDDDDDDTPGPNAPATGSALATAAGIALLVLSLLTVPACKSFTRQDADTGKAVSGLSCGVVSLVCSTGVLGDSGSEWCRKGLDLCLDLKATADAALDATVRVYEMLGDSLCVGGGDDIAEPCSDEFIGIDGWTCADWQKACDVGAEELKEPCGQVVEECAAGGEGDVFTVRLRE